jgi:hypothetical protein
MRNQVTSGVVFAIKVQFNLIITSVAAQSQLSGWEIVSVAESL